MSPDASGRLPQASAAVWIAFRLGEDVVDDAADVPAAAGADEDAECGQNLMVPWP